MSAQAFVRGALVASVLSIVLYLAHSVTGFGPGLDTVFDVYVATGLSVLASVVCFVGARVRRGDRLAWMLAAGALGSWAVGDMLFQALYTGEDPPVPSVADLFYASMYPALAVAIVLVARKRLRDVGLWLDGIVAGLTLIAILFAVGYAPIADAAEGDTLTVATALAYPIGDLILLGLVTAIITMMGLRPGLQAWLFAGGLALITVADWVFAHQVVRGAYELGGPIDTAWPAGMLAIAFAAWVKPPPRVGRVTTAPWSTYAVAAVLAVAALSILMADDYTQVPVAASWLAATALVLRAVRTTLTFRDKHRALQQAQVAAAIVDSADLAIFRTDRDGTVRTWNPGAVATFGRETAEAVGRRLPDLFPDAAAVVAPAFASAAAGDAVTIELALAGGDRAAQLLIRLSPIRADGDHVTGVTVIARDITEHMAGQQAQRQNEAKNQFLSRMSHELRTPLNAVLGFGQLLQLRDLDPEARDEVDHILKAGDHLLELINETLEISHIESGRLSLTIEPVTPAEVVGEAVALLAPLSAARGIAVEVDEESLTASIAADRQRLKQVLLNLLSNAIKFNAYGGTVRVRGAHFGDERVAIAVSDTGSGIAAEDMPRLFSPFERLRPGAEDVEGSGLGLALSKGLLEAMGGSIDAVSAVGEGSTFTLELPEAAAAEDTQPERPLGERPAPLERSAGPEVTESRTVLCIEDTAQNLELMEQVFATIDDIDLITATDGASGLARARQAVPDLVLLDLHLPDAEGAEVLDRLRTDARTRHVPVIVVSADATPAQIDALLARGAFDYVTKPIDIARLIEVMDDALVGSAAS